MVIGTSSHRPGILKYLDESIASVDTGVVLVRFRVDVVLSMKQTCGMILGITLIRLRIRSPVSNA